MKTIIFIISIVIGAIFFFAGIMKLYKSYNSKFVEANWKNEKVLFIRFISWCEIIGALLFIIPYSINLLPFLSIITAFGLAFLIVGAPISHLKMGEQREAALTSSLLILILLITFFRIFGE